jgi:hypothetical protein
MEICERIEHNLDLLIQIYEQCLMSEEYFVDLVLDSESGEDQNHALGVYLDAVDQTQKMLEAIRSVREYVVIKTDHLFAKGVDNH